MRPSFNHVVAKAKPIEKNAPSELANFLRSIEREITQISGVILFLPLGYLIDRDANRYISIWEVNGSMDLSSIFAEKEFIVLDVIDSRPHRHPGSQRHFVLKLAHAQVGQSEIGKWLASAKHSLQNLSAEDIHILGFADNLGALFDVIMDHDRGLHLDGKEFKLLTT